MGRYENSQTGRRNLELLLHRLLIEANSIQGKSEPNIDANSLPQFREAVVTFKSLGKDDQLKLKYFTEELDRALEKIERYFAPPKEEDIEYWLRH